MTLVYNERTKLTATWLNSIAAAVAVGGISLTIAAASGVMSFMLAVMNDKALVEASSAPAPCSFPEMGRVGIRLLEMKS